MACRLNGLAGLNRTKPHGPFEHFRRLLPVLIVPVLLGCAAQDPGPLNLSDDPVTDDGLHEVATEQNYVLYMSPSFTEKARAGAFRKPGQGMHIRSCSVSFVDEMQKARFADMRGPMQDYLCDTVKAGLDERGVPRTEVEDLRPDTRVVDLWLLHVDISLPPVGTNSSTSFVFSGASGEMTFGWISSEAGSGLPILRYYQRGRFGHSGHFVGDPSAPNWSDVRREIDVLAENALDTLLPAVFSAIRQSGPVTPIEPDEPVK